MKNSVFSRLLIVSITFLSLQSVYAIWEWDRINMTVSPIRDEFTAPNGTTVNRQVTFYNNADVPYTVYITTEDCEPWTNYWTPICHPASWTGSNLLNSSTWITTDEPWMFTVWANSNRVINYRVTVPTDAPPWGHYGAIFFNNPDMAVSGNAVRMNRRIGMLYLMTVPWQIVVETNFWDILVDAGPGGWSSSIGPDSLMTLFSAPQEFIDKSIKWLMMIFTDPEETEKLLAEINPIWTNPTLTTDEEFLVTLRIPIDNAGNTHITPTGKIYLYDGDTQLNRIGRQSIVDDNWVYLWEKIVDFLPVNDEWGNVLPRTDRTFNIDWAWFATDDIDPTTGKRIIRFESPASYYSRTAWTNSQILMPWEKFAKRTMNKSLRASVEITYKNPLTKLNEVSTFDIPVPIHYTYIAKTLNWSAIILILLVVFLIWMVKRRNNKIHDLEDETELLEDEISVLERAYSWMKQTEKPAPKKRKKVTEPIIETVVEPVIPEKRRRVPRKKTTWTTEE